MSTFNDIKKLNAFILNLNALSGEMIVEAYGKNNVLINAYKKTAPDIYEAVENHTPYLKPVPVLENA